MLSWGKLIKQYLLGSWIELDISRESVRIEKHKYRSSKYQLRQHMYETYSVKWVVYCRWVPRDNVQPNNKFFKTTVFSDESRFINYFLGVRNQNLFWIIIGVIIFDGLLSGSRYVDLGKLFAVF